MNEMFALSGARIFDGEGFYDDHVLVFQGEAIVGVFKKDRVPEGCEIINVDGGMLVPAYIDLQVNGGGGVLFNNNPDVEAIKVICEAHARFGTGALLVTLISDTSEMVIKAIDAAVEASKQMIPGFLGLHLEGPHFSPEKNGVHDAELFRVMSNNDLQQLVNAKKRLRHLKVTLSPSAVSNEQISKLRDAGVVVSLGHANSTFSEAKSAIDAGASCVTHLYNAMSPLGHRDPGMVGAALTSRSVFAGLIADGFHVDPAAISIALSAKGGPGKIFLVTDAMSTVGSEIDRFLLNGKQVLRKGGKLVSEDGTLAGSHLDMNSAVMYMKNVVGITLEESIRMASLYPAQCMGCDDRVGYLREGYEANIVHVDEGFSVSKTWAQGKIVYAS